jgi:hypothetical protein
MNADPEQLEVVFYSGPAPRSLATLTLVGLIFDRVHFPNVHVPHEGFDPEWVVREVQRIEALGFRDYDTWLLCQMLRYALHPELGEFCYFTGTQQQAFGSDKSPGTTKLVDALYRQMFGPIRPDFQPQFTTGHSKGLPHDQSIDYPGMFFYQANALLYAGRHGIPLLNDDPRFPVPVCSGSDAKHNAKVLASIMALECVNLVLPEIGELQPEQIVEAREDLSRYVRPFRRSLLGLASKLNAQILSTSDYEEIKRAAEFVATTDVYPALADLKNELDKANHKSWIPRTWDLAKKVPELVVDYSTGNFGAAVQSTIAAFGSWFIAGKMEEAPRSGLHYLLKLQDRVLKQGSRSPSSR